MTRDQQWDVQCESKWSLLSINTYLNHILTTINIKNIIYSVKRIQKNTNIVTLFRKLSFCLRKENK